MRIARSVQRHEFRQAPILTATIVEQAVARTSLLQRLSNEETRIT